MPSPDRRNIAMKTDVWNRIQAAAAQECARQGRTVSVSEWIRTWAEAVIENGLTFEDVPALAKVRRKK